MCYLVLTLIPTQSKDLALCANILQGLLHILHNLLANVAVHCSESFLYIGRLLSGKIMCGKASMSLSSLLQATFEILCYLFQFVYMYYCMETENV